MCTEKTPTITKHVAELEDPRCPHLILHPLINIIVIALCASIAGADGWTDVETFGKSKRLWLSQFLNLEKGIPSHDTLRPCSGQAIQ